MTRKYLFFKKKTRKYLLP